MSAYKIPLQNDHVPELESKEYTTYTHNTPFLVPVSFTIYKCEMVPGYLVPPFEYWLMVLYILCTTTLANKACSHYKFVDIFASMYSCT